MTSPTAPHPVQPLTPARPALPCHVAIVGPTASGKTAAALAIAARWPVEVISVDSALVYRGMDIGTAKPTAAELAAVPHHLINIRDPLQAYSAAEFAVDARRLMLDITARGKLPLLVGGTMLYLKALTEGLDDMPHANPAIRAELQRQAELVGWPALHAELAQVDPITAARLAPADSQRISRALEVYRATGQPLSAFQTIKNRATQAISTGATGPFDVNLSTGSENASVATYSIAANALSISATGLKGLKNSDSLLISLEPQDRAWLHQRIAQRFDAMLASGFLDEVKALRARGDLHPDLPAMRCVGYRQAWDYLDALAAQRLPAAGAGVPPRSNTLLWAELRDTGIAATRQLAKRQITWLRSTPERQVVACDAPDALAQVLERVAAFVKDIA
ncbi:tRNA (adenosine(37)-N6)-dimethylallyltransferase MiaA [Rhodoferax sp.]|uniref:tRNA (adenosine(37)-N6)-dimethylallyltransferase MiaA n=1 Tax=Rhodoferax sp. TaxID=50421 RepID=UPI002611D055|nr:tRNA (adenosine(37)-N6)-dimethylallyltransferase MiaA [Rhodoferax sp.]MDD5480568.1 tRNA (adenosine(37)-N6)-dimethylallyltransferase MiaA [Rhodoferax sp.]